MRVLFTVVYAGDASLKFQRQFDTALCFHSWWAVDLKVARADQGSVKAPCQYRLAMGSINEGSDFSMHSATKFKCNFVVIDVVHSGIKMTGSYFSEFRWDEKCCNSLHEYKDYSKTHPLPQYAQMVSQYTSCIGPRDRVQVVPPAASDSCNNTLP